MREGGWKKKRVRSKLWWKEGNGREKEVSSHGDVWFSFRSLKVEQVGRHHDLLAFQRAEGRVRSCIPLLGPFGAGMGVHEGGQRRRRRGRLGDASRGLFFDLSSPALHQQPKLHQQLKERPLDQYTTFLSNLTFPSGSPPNSIPSSSSAFRTPSDPPNSLVLLASLLSSHLAAKQHPTSTATRTSPETNGAGRPRYPARSEKMKRRMQGMRTLM